MYVYIFIEFFIVYKFIEVYWKNFWYRITQSSIPDSKRYKL